MQTDDIARLIMYVRAIYPSRAANLSVDPMTVEAWSDVLAGTEYTFAKQAVLALSKASSFMPDPGDIQREATSIVRRDVFGVSGGGPAVFTDALPDVDPDDVTAYLAAIRAGRRQLIKGAATGETQPRAIAAGPQLSAEQIDQQAQSHGVQPFGAIGRMPRA
jgi:hypothetical protein